MRAFYRVTQFWQALRSVPTPQEIAEVRGVLSPALMDLFLRMQKSEQAHSVRIYQALSQQQQQPEDLLVAALLHDVGKALHPLHLWERVEIVLAQALFPGALKEWGNARPGGWRRPFVIAAQHPAWGAQMAAEAGASPLCVALIRRHQETIQPGTQPRSLEEQLLAQLQQVDNSN